MMLRMRSKGGMRLLLLESVGSPYRHKQDIGHSLIFIG